MPTRILLDATLRAPMSEAAAGFSMPVPTWAAMAVRNWLSRAPHHYPGEQMPAFAVEGLRRLRVSAHPHRDLLLGRWLAETLADGWTVRQLAAASGYSQGEVRSLTDHARSEHVRPDLLGELPPLPQPPALPPTPTQTWAVTLHLDPQTMTALRTATDSLSWVLERAVTQAVVEQLWLEGHPTQTVAPAPALLWEHHYSLREDAPT